MTLLLKDPDAVLDYAIDWGADYLAGDDMLVQSDWAVVPDEADGIAIAGSDFDAKTTSVKAQGGLAGHIYQLVNRVVMDSGLIDERTIVLRVEKR